MSNRPGAKEECLAKQTRVRFDSDGVTCVGYFYRLTDSSTPRPCVVLANGFTGTQDTPSIQATAHEFAPADLAALTFDYRNFGESDGTPRQLASMKGE